MRRTILVAAALLSAATGRAQDGDALEQARAILGRVASTGPGNLRVGALAPVENINVEGRKGTGKLGNIGGGTKFFAEFKSGGVVVMGTAEEGTTFRGTWSQSGKTIVMKAGASTFTGTLDGDRITGTRARKSARGLNDTEDGWELTLEK